MPRTTLNPNRQPLTWMTQPLNERAIEQRPMSARPSWLNDELYPFASRHFDTTAGRLHYVDEGRGSAIVFVHGNPTWSFTWRHLIAGLRGEHRCIAMDHIGFGLSDKPEHVLTPSDHTAHLGQLLDHLGVEKVTLVVEDWGGPIGLAWAMENAPRIERVVVLNSWCWSVAGDPHFERFSAFMGGRIGRFLIKTFNAFARFVLPKAVGHRLPRQVHRHYLAPFPTRESRNACANFPKQIISESDWLSAVWRQRHQLNEVPILLYWGRRDIAFRDDELKRWTEAFPHADVHSDNRAGHCPQESAPERLLPLLQGFLQDPASEGRKGIS